LGPGEGRGAARTSATADVGELPARELIGLLPGMEPRALEALRAQEEAGPARKTVLSAIDSQLGRASAPADA
jgi:hypothetical protein